jgi:glycosyltransferase involved in cell wall biosynthesis
VTPAVSVIVPTFNRARLLPEAIDSVLRQTCTDFELIVVDDGSTDGTETAVAARPDPRIRYLRQPHSGISSALNTGVRAARGRYVARIDSDDRWHSEMLATLVPILEADMSAAAAYGVGQAMDADGRALPHTQGNQGRFPGDTLRSLVFDDCTCNVALVVRRACLEEAGLYDEQLAANEDWDMWLRVARRRQRFVFVDTILASIRWHDGNLTGPASPQFAGVLAARTAPLDKLFADPELPAAVLAMQSAAYANVYLFRGARWLQAGHAQRALAEFWKSVRTSDDRLAASLRIAWRIGLVPILTRWSFGRWATALPSRVRRRRERRGASRTQLPSRFAAASRPADK